MGNKTSALVDHVIVHADLDKFNRGPVLRVFLDYMQFPLGGIIGITLTSN
jgi:hypothetical protein